MDNTKTPDICPECEGLQEMCENCEIIGCPECTAGWVYTDDGCWLCPECAAALRELYNKETENGTKVCGTCSLFMDEDIEGDGWCEFHQESRRCSEYCTDRIPK